MGVYSMKRFAFLATVFTTALVLVLPFVGGGGPGLAAPGVVNSGSATSSSASITGPYSSQVVDRSLNITVTPAPRSVMFTGESAGTSAEVAYDAPTASENGFAVGSTGVTSPDLETAPGKVGQVVSNPGCPSLGSVNVGSAPSTRSAGGVAGTTSSDLASFAAQYNAIRLANCLQPVTRFIYDSCMEQRLFWMAESPSPDPLDAWGHIGSTRIDGVPSVGCDGNLAGGSGNTGATVAQKWWDSTSHRASLYRPTSSVSGVCIALAMTHGGIDEPSSFTRAAARWVTC
jgi:uncharacterized protein YkwD